MGRSSDVLRIYSQFLARKQAKLPALRIESWESLRLPGESVKSRWESTEDGRLLRIPDSGIPVRIPGRHNAIAFPGIAALEIPPHVAIGPHVVRALRRHIRFPMDQKAISDGPLALFRGVAYCELWHKHGMLWPLQYALRPMFWDAKASGRSHTLLEEWQKWRLRMFGKG